MALPFWLARLKPSQLKFDPRNLMIVMNARTLAGAMGGQQRVTAEIAKRLPQMKTISPQNRLLGAKGHLWEQMVLPALLGKNWLWSPSGTGPLLVKNQIVTMHDAAPFDVPECFSLSFVRFYRMLLPLLGRRVKKIVTVSEFSKQRLMLHLGIPDDHIKVIYNGVSEQFRPYDEEAITKVRSSLALPDAYFLVAATADKRKNFANVVKIWREIADRMPDDLHLVAMGNLSRTHVFGDHDLDHQRAKRFKHIGFVKDDEIGPLMAGARAFLFPSLYEGFGLPILEAMACGVPVLTSNRGAMAEIAGHAALLADPENHADLAKGMIELAHHEDMRQKLRIAGLEHAQFFTWDKAASAYQNLFDQLMEESA